MSAGIFKNGNNESSNSISVNLNNYDLKYFCPFLSHDSEKILFTLTCNHLSLGQFELARSSILQMNSLNFRKVSEVLSSIIHHGPPPDWQLSVTIPTSANFILACIREYELYFRKSANFENYILRRTELDLLIGNMITNCFDYSIDFETIKMLRYFCFLFLISEVDFKAPELKVLPKIVGLPSYLSRLPSFSLNSSKLFENLSIDLVNKEKLNSTIIDGMFKCFEKSRVHFIQIAKILIVYSNTKKFEIGQSENNLSLRNTLSTINISLNWMILKKCILDLIFFKENYGVISISSLVKTILKNISALKLESIFVNFEFESKHFPIEQNTSFDEQFLKRKEPEDVISIIFVIFSIANLFCKYDLEEEIFAKFLSEQIEILKTCEDICNISAFESKVLSNINSLFSGIPINKLNNFQRIQGYLNRINSVKLVENGKYNDQIGALINLSSDESLTTKILLKFDDYLFDLNFGVNNYLGIFSLPKYIGSVSKVVLHQLINENYLINYKYDENPIFWCEYLRYLSLSNNKFEELPIIFVLNLLDMYKAKNDVNLFQAANKIILCFPHLRAICIFLGMKNDPVFNWELLKNLWLPFRLLNEGDKLFEDECLVFNLDEISRRHAISIFISEKLNLSNCDELIYNSNKNPRIILEEITLKKSIIKFYFDNFKSSNKYTTVNWMTLETFISSIISLPLTVSSDISLLIEERDCIKSYLLQKEVFEKIDGKENSGYGLNLQNISIEIGNIQTNYFHNELIYCFFCQTFIYLKKFKMSNSQIQPTSKRFFCITQLLYYLLIWSIRLSRDYQIKMLPVINATFKKAILMIELILFSFPFKVPSIPLQTNLEIFTWWYRFILLTPSRVFNTSKSLFHLSKSSEYFRILFQKRWILRKTYENNPWYSNLLSFEPKSAIVCCNKWSNEDYPEILLSSSILVLKLLSIQNYEKSIELLLSSKFCDNIILITLDSFIFHALFEEESVNNYNNINTIYGIIRNIINESLPNCDQLDIEQLSLFSVMEEFLSYIQIKLNNSEGEFGWVLYVFPKIYLAFLLVDFCIYFGNKNVSISLELIERAKHILEQNKNELNDQYELLVQTTLDRLFIFYQSPSTISLTRYIMEIDALPEQTSQIKTHLNIIQDRKLITTAITHSLNFLSGFSLNKSQSENILNINQILEHYLFSNGNKTNYLFSVLNYIKSIISELFSNLDNYKAFPILTLTPDEIISYSFFERKLKFGTSRLSKIMKADFISVIIKTLNSLDCSDSNFKSNKTNSYCEIDFLFEQFYPFKGTFIFVAHNIMTCEDVQYGFFMWNFAVKNRINYIKRKAILSSLEYRIWKYNIHKQLESKLPNISLDKVSGFKSFKSLEYFNFLFKWLLIVETFFFSNDLHIQMQNFENRVGFINYLFSIPSNSHANTVSKIVIELSRKILGNKNKINLNSSNFKRILKLNSLISIYKLIKEAQEVLDPHFILSVIEIACKDASKYSYSKLSSSKLKNHKRKFTEMNINTILRVQRLFCISYIKHFKGNSNLWNKWCVLFKEWKSTRGIILLLNFLIEIKLFNIAKLISQELLYKVLEYNGDNNYSEKELSRFFSENKFFSEIRKITHLNNFSIASNINCIIASLKDDHNFQFQRFNINKLSKSAVSKRVCSFESIITLLNSDIDMNEKYLIVDAYINSQSQLLDINRISVLKTILTSLKLVRDLGIRDIRVSYLFSPYLIIRLAILTRNCRLVEILKRDIEIFLKSDDILLNLIEESFGVIGNKQFLLEKIKTSFIFGQADIKMCSQFFHTENNTEQDLNIEEVPFHNIDIYFSIKLISIIPKKKIITDLLLKISDAMSSQFYTIFKKSILGNSLVRPRFECSNSQLWVAEEGSLKIVPRNIHPFSKFSSARKSSFYTKNRCINIYKARSKLGIERMFGVKNEINIQNISKLRTLQRNLLVLLTWASCNIGKGEFEIAIKSISYLLEIWQKIPKISFSLKDLVFLDDKIVQLLICSDQLSLLKDLSKNTFEPEKKFLEKNSESGNSTICNLVRNSMAISKINQYYNGRIHKDLITLNVTRSRNEMIMEIFSSKWKVNKEKIFKIENFKDDARIIENILLQKPDILNMNFLIIILTYHCWEMLQSYDYKQKDRLLHFPLISVKSEVFSSTLSELYDQSLTSNAKTGNNTIQTLSELVYNLNELSVRVEDHSDLYTSSNDSLCLSYTTFFLEKIINSIKKNKFSKENQTVRIIENIILKKQDGILICYEKNIIRKKKFFQFDFINHLLVQNTPNHYLVINTFVKLNLWWEAMIYILRWSFELGSSKSRSLLIEKKRESQTDYEQTFEELFYDLVLKNAHLKNQFNSLICAINEAVPLGGPRAAIFVKKCKHAIQRYLEYNGALEMLYSSFLSFSVSIEIPHAMLGAIGIHLSLLNHLSIDSRSGYLESALYHFKNASLILKKKSKTGISKKNHRSPTNYINHVSVAENPSLPQSLMNVEKLSDLLIPFIADVPIYKINTSPWGGLSLNAIQRIIKLLELQNSIIKLLIRENACTSILSPNYNDRRDAIVILFLIREYSLAFRASNLIEIPTMEVLVQATSELIFTYPNNNSLPCFLDSMKLWLSEYDSDALISNAINMWISEKKINLNNISEFEKKGVMELINRLSNTLSRSEAYNMINPSKKVGIS